MKPKVGFLSFLLLITGLFAACTSSVANTTPVPPVAPTPRLPTEDNFPMGGKVHFTPAPAGSSPEKPVEEVLRIVMVRYFKDEPSRAYQFLADKPEFKSELRTFSKDASSQNATIPPTLVWVVGIVVPSDVPCGPGVAEPGVRVECPPYANLMSVVDANSGAILDASLLVK